MKTVRLGSIAESLPCDYGDDPANGAPAFEVVKVSNVSGEGQFHGDFEKRRFRDDQLEGLLVREGELLVVKSSGSKANILSGKTAICGADRAGRIVASNFLLRLRVNEAAAVPRFVWYVLNGGASKAFVKTIVGASTYPNLKWSSYASHPIPLPPLAEQQRIAEVLDRAEALRAKRRAALAQLDSLTQSLFFDLFGDPVRNEKSWSAYPFSEIAVFENGDRSANYPSGDDIKSNGILFLSTKNIVDDRLDLNNAVFITSEKFDSLSRGKAQPNDLIITLRGTLGSCCIFDCRYQTAFINAQMMIIRPRNEMSSVFLHGLLTSKPAKDRFERIGYGVAVPQLTAAQLAKLPIPVPPITLQREFARQVDAVEKLKAAQRASLAELDALFASLQYRAFRGEL